MDKSPTNHYESHSQNEADISVTNTIHIEAILAEMDSLKIWNLNTALSQQHQIQFPEVGHFVTCLRHLVIGISPIEKLGAPQFEGWAAYQQLLSVICGLQSPVLGETEVFGQFKVQSKEFPENLQKIVRLLLADAKTVRTRHLSGFGGASYGSIAREYLKGADQIVVLGAGHLAQEIYPWLAKSAERIFVCSRKKKPFLVSTAGSTQVVSMNELKDLTCQLVIAAPISNSIIQDWIGKNNIKLEKVVDFRQAASGEFPGALTLEMIFSKLQKNQDERAAIKAEAFQTIEEILESHKNKSDLRPLGWEDLCV